MPRQVGIISLVGTFGEYSFYLRQGVPVVRRKGGPKKSRIMRHPRMKPVREHINEFRGYAVGTKTLKSALTPVMYMRDSTFHNRVMSLCSRICNQSDGPDGKRAISFSKAGKVAVDLEVNALHPFRSACKTRFTSTPSADRKTSRLKATINIEAEIVAPKKSVSHFRILHVLCVVPDVTYRNRSKTYEPVDTEDACELHYSKYIALNTKEPVAINLATTLPVSSIPTNAGVLELVGIEFYSHSNGRYKAKFDKRALVVRAAW